MKPRINVLTLGVDNLEKAMAFYRDGLGLETKGITGTQFEHGAVVFFHLKDDLILALFPKASLAHDSKLAAPTFSIGHLVKSKQEVDEVIAQARKAGAKVTDPPHDRVWGGYSGYFQDKDGHLWEIVWNPDIPVSD
jgi:hypothetical protein